MNTKTDTKICAQDFSKILLITLALAGAGPLSAGNLILYSQPPSGSGGLYQSSVNGTDYDQMTWDWFKVANSTAITEVRWRGGYLYGGVYSGAVTNWTVSFYRDIANGYQPDIINPPFATYTISGNANETGAGTFGGAVMYDYSYTLPSPFIAQRGSNYWILIKAVQGGIPEWGLAQGTGGDGKCFRRIAGVGDWYYYIGSGDTAFTLVTSDAPTAAISAIGSPAGTGEIIGDGPYPVGSTATLTARPAAGYGFLNWTENGTSLSTASTLQFVVSTNRTIIANFTPRYTIGASASPNYGGTVTGGGTYNSNSLVTVLATPATGYSFVNWTDTGTEVSTTPDYSFNATASRNLAANFTAGAAAATFDFDSGMPPVFPTQGMPGSQWNNGVTAYFSTMSGGWSIQNTFYGWVPGVFSGNFLYPSTWGSTVGISFNLPVTNLTLAFFTGDVASEYDIPTKVRVQAFTNGASTTPVAQATAQGAWLTGAYPEGTLTLSSPTPFTRVTVDMPSGQGLVSYLMFLDNIVVQHAPLPPVTVTASASPANGGSVNGAGTFANGSTVTLTATPAAGYDFVNWTENGNPVSAGAIFGFVATTDRALVANFVQLPPTSQIVAIASPSNGGIVGGGGVYTNGDIAALTATHNTGYSFVNWTENGVEVSATESFSFTVATDRVLVANFETIVIPLLEIQLAGGMAVLSWPTNSSGFTLEQTLALNTANWAAVTNAVNTVGGFYRVSIPSTNRATCFRLTHP
jgi:hypothetical protein